MEKNIIKNQNKMSNLIFSSTNLSYLNMLLNAQNLAKDLRANLEKRGLIGETFKGKGKDALSKRVKSLSAYDIKTKEYVKTNLLNLNVYYNLPRIVNKYLEVPTETNKLNTTDKEEKPSFLMYYPDINTTSCTKDINNLPKNMLNKYINFLSKFELDLAANQSIYYKYNSTYNYSNLNLYKLFVSSLNSSYVLLSQPHITNKINSVDISLFFYSYVLSSKNLKLSTSSFLNRNEKRLRFLCENLSLLFKKSIKLDLVRLYHPSSDSNILANAIGAVSNKTKIRNFKKKLLKRSQIVNPNKIVDKVLYTYSSLFETKKVSPGILSGLNVRIAGRLVTEKVVPRKTVRTFQIGSLARSKATIVKTDRYTRKNKRGCFSVTVKTGHIVN